MGKHTCARNADTLQNLDINEISSDELQNPLLFPFRSFPYTRLSMSKVWKQVAEWSKHIIFKQTHYSSMCLKVTIKVSTVNL